MSVIRGLPLDFSFKGQVVTDTSAHVYNLRGNFVLPYWFEYSITDSTRIEHIDTFITSGDMVIKNDSYITYTDKIISYDVVSSNGGNVIISTDNPNIKIDNNVVQQIGDDTIATIQLKLQTAIRTENITFTKTINNVIYNVINGINGSARKNATEIIDNRLIGKNPSTDKAVFTLQDHINSNYIRNTSCWAYGLNITCASPWNSDSGQYKAGTLISPQHIVFANHYTYPNGTVIRFITQNNEVVNRTLVNQARVGTTDIKIGLLDESVPESINFAKVLDPSIYASKFKTGINRIPCMQLDFSENALVADGANFITGSSQIPQIQNRLNFYEDKIVGDSGNPVFIFINNDPVILYCFHYGGPGSGPSISYYANDINSVMVSLGGGYQLTFADLSGFTTFV